MSYLIVFVLSVIVAFLGFALEVTNGNIGHVENGREPNAGAALFPTIPFGPLSMVGIAWLLDCIYADLGFWFCVILIGLYVPYWALRLRYLSRKLRLRIASRHQDSAQ